MPAALLIVGEVSEENDSPAPWPSDPGTDDSSIYDTGSHSAPPSPHPHHTMSGVGEAEDGDCSAESDASWANRHESSVWSAEIDSNDSDSSPPGATLIVGEADASDNELPPPSWTSQSSRSITDDEDADEVNAGAKSLVTRKCASDSACIVT